MPSSQNREETLLALAVEKLADKGPASSSALIEGEPALCQLLEALPTAHGQFDDLSPNGKPAAVATIKLDLSEPPMKPFARRLTIS
jgi:hypothetical protein